MSRFGRLNYTNRHKRWIGRILGSINWAKLVFFGLVGGTILVVGLFWWFSRDLPDPNEIQRKKGFSTQILDRKDETVLFDVYDEENRLFTPLNDIPQALRQGTIAVEDKDFYKHQGFDLLGIVRGFTRIFTSGRAEGGSTLTQQLVKNVLLTNERSLARKIKELVLAVQIERRFSKDEVLQMYLNEAPYGGTAWGIAAAAEQYFGKKPTELDLTQSIILAGMPQAPSKYSPYGKNPLAYVARASAVARRMREDGYITRDQEKDVVSRLPSVSFRPTGSSIKAPHFVMYVRDWLNDRFGEEVVSNGGLKVTTSLDWALQDKAQQIVSEEIEKVAAVYHITNGASLIVDAQTGEILSMVGSRGFFDKDHDGQVNVTLSQRQPGSSIKPVTYATAFEKGIWLGKVLADVVTDFPSGDSDKPYAPEDYDGKEHGLVHLRDALGSSLNIPAVKLLAQIGLKDMLSMAARLGISSLEPSSENIKRFGLSVTLGGGEVSLLQMTSAYAAFANGGMKIEPVAVLKVEDRDGKALYENKPSAKKRVLDEKVAFLIDSVLSDNKARLISFGPNSLLNIGGRNVAVKTGTTNDQRDNWAVGWTKKVVIGVWVGNNDNSEMKRVASGVSGASPIWRRQMLEALSRFGDPAFDPPAGVEQVDLDLVSGYPAHDGWPSYKEWVIKGSLPSENDPIHKVVPLCPGDPTKLANSVQIQDSNFQKGEFIIVHENDPLTGDNLWQKAIDGWIGKQNDSRYHPPTSVCGDTNSVGIQILEPGNNSRIDSNEVKIRVSVASDQSIEWVDLYLDGNKEARWEKPPYEQMFTLDIGVHEIRVRARNSVGIENETSVNIGVKVEVNPTPTP